MRSFNILFSPNALTDVDDAIAYYEDVQIGVGKRFASRLQLTLNAINRNPFFASIRYDDIRCAALKKFPFLIHYHVDEKNALVTILAVYSTYKEPLW